MGMCMPSCSRSVVICSATAPPGGRRQKRSQCAVSVWCVAQSGRIIFQTISRSTLWGPRTRTKISRRGLKVGGKKIKPPPPPTTQKKNALKICDTTTPYRPPRHTFIWIKPVVKKLERGPCNNTFYLFYLFFRRWTQTVASADEEWERQTSASLTGPGRGQHWGMNSRHIWKVAAWIPPGAFKARGSFFIL